MTITMCYKYNAYNKEPRMIIATVLLGRKRGDTLVWYQRKTKNKKQKDKKKNNNKK